MTDVAYDIGNGLMVERNVNKKSLKDIVDWVEYSHGQIIIS